MSENDNPQPEPQITGDRPQPPKTIGKPVQTEFINSEQQPTTPESSDIN
ncbi:MAG: hypothetical protein V7L14_08625 [Nostoc sp.]|nr:hypothetical protein [Nostoc sp. NOS(2021)]MBN3898222.1 hypothetical protein [Nostoc sp. NOS(2021)]